MMSLFVNWNVDPVLFSIGPLELRYYGISWALAFGVGMWYFTRCIKREGLPEKLFDSLFWFGTLSTIIGARLGHILFYEPASYLSEPWRILNIREGGLASHGAALGLLLGLWIFSRRAKMPYVWSLDRIMVPVTIGGASVRLGNLMNSEIYGIQTDMPWGFIFRRVGETVPMHPTQIYEALCYIAIFIVLMWLYYKKNMARRQPGFMFGLGVALVFLSRFFIEFIKNPQVEFEEGMSLMMGQWLSVPFILAGMAMMVWSFSPKAAKAVPDIALPNQTKKKKKK